MLLDLIACVGLNMCSGCGNRPEVVLELSFLLMGDTKIKTQGRTLLEKDKQRAGFSQGLMTLLRKDALKPKKQYRGH